MKLECNGLEFCHIKLESIGVDSVKLALQVFIFSKPLLLFFFLSSLWVSSSFNAQMHTQIIVQSNMEQTQTEPGTKKNKRKKKTLAQIEQRNKEK